MIIINFIDKKLLIRQSGGAVAGSDSVGTAGSSPPDSRSTTHYDIEIVLTTGKQLVVFTRIIC